MTERLEPKSPRSRRARRRAPVSRAGRLRDTGAVPVPAPTAVPVEGEPTLLGFPAEFAEEDDAAAEVAGDDPLDASRGLTVLKRADPVGAGALVLAGVAANVSLLLSWAPGEGPTGLSLVQGGVEALRSGWAEIQVVLWQPPVVVVSGGLLVLLGLLLLVPARTHRLVGLLALIVSLAAAFAVVVLLVESDLADDRFGPGMWCAVAVPVLGALGSLKAMLTVPLVTLDAYRSPSADDVAGLGL
jgi:hypothetical protein